MNLWTLKICRIFHLISKVKYDEKRQIEIVKASPLFDAKWYLEQNPDVKAKKISAARHYVKWGWKEGRNPSKEFDGNEYLRLNPDVRCAEINPLVHYETFGKRENRRYCSSSVSANKDQPLFHIQKPGLLDKIICHFKNKSPFISVIVTSYNYEKYIKETLDSLMAQTYKNFEVIVIDDGSTDKSVKVIKQYVKKYPNIFLYQHIDKKNHGLPETIKLALEKSKGEYIAFCESDDYWTPDHLEEKVKLINSYAHVNIITNDVQTFGNFKRCCLIERDTLTPLRKIFSQIINKFSYQDFRNINRIPTLSCFLARKTCLLKCNLTDNPRPSATDWWIYRQLAAKNNKIYYIPYKLTFWRMHDSYNSTQAEDYILKQDIFNEQSDIVCHKYSIHKQDDKVSCILSSSLFDKDWYIKKYKIHDINPAKHYLYFGWKQGFNPSEKFDGNLYLSFYDDVKAAGINPLLHYEKFGKNKRYIVNPNYKPIDVLIISSVRKYDGVYFWRVDFLKELLEKHSFSVEDESLASLSDDFLSKFYSARLIIFNRPLGSGISAQILKELRQLHKKFIIDIDDLLLSDFAAFSGRYKSGKISYENTVNNMYLQSLCFSYSQIMSVSTKLIADEIYNKFGLKSFLLPNVISTKYLQNSKRYIHSGLNLLYASGSDTHGFDAASVYLDLFNFMAKHKDVTLTIIGTSNFQAGFNIFKDRVQVIPFVDFESMLKIYAQNDLLLIPLDDNPFNNAKSNIKYIEAGAVGTPVLAKDCAEFASVIKNGQNGFLYHDNFYQQLEYIYVNKTILLQVGLNAYECVKKNHSTNSVFPKKLKELICY